MGETPNVAARLQGIAEPNSVVIAVGEIDQPQALRKPLAIETGSRSLVMS